MLKKISMVALLVSVCTAASAVTTFNKTFNTKPKNAVVSVEKTNKTTDTSKSCDFDSGLKEKVASLETKMSEAYKAIETMKKDNPDTGTIQKEMQAMKDDYNNQINKMNDNYNYQINKMNDNYNYQINNININIESLKKKLNEIQSK